METANIHTANHTWLMVKKEAMENRRKLLFAAGGWTGLCALVGGWMGYFGAGGGYSVMLVYVFMFTIATSVLASLSFNDMKTREGRIALLMTPATAADKTLTRAIGLIATCIVLGFIGYVAIEGFRLLIDGIANHEWTSFFWPDPSMIFNGAGVVDRIWGYFLIAGAALFGIAFYFLGSILWPKYSFLKTMVAGWVLQMAFGTLMIPMSKMSWSWIGLNPDVFLKIVIVVIWILSTALFFLAWWRLKRSTVVSRLF